MLPILTTWWCSPIASAELAIDQISQIFWPVWQSIDTERERETKIGSSTVCNLTTSNQPRIQVVSSPPHPPKVKTKTSPFKTTTPSQFKNIPGSVHSRLPHPSKVKITQSILSGPPYPPNMEIIKISLLRPENPSKVQTDKKQIHSKSESCPIHSLQCHNILPKWKQLKTAPSRSTKPSESENYKKQSVHTRPLQPLQDENAKNQSFQDHHTFPKFKMSKFSPCKAKTPILRGLFPETPANECAEQSLPKCHQGIAISRPSSK